VGKGRWLIEIKAKIRPQGKRGCFVSKQSDGSCRQQPKAKETIMSDTQEVEMTRRTALSLAAALAAFGAAVGIGSSIAIAQEKGESKEEEEREEKEEKEEKEEEKAK
jgi:hypothetical protein